MHFSYLDNFQQGYGCLTLSKNEVKPLYGPSNVDDLPVGPKVCIGAGTGLGECYLTPNDTDINKKGITPDVVVDLNEKLYKAGHGPWWLDPDGAVTAAKHKPEDGKDDQLQKAISLLETKVKGHVIVNNTDAKPITKQ